VEECWRRWIIHHCRTSGEGGGEDETIEVIVEVKEGSVVGVQVDSCCFKSSSVMSLLLLSLLSVGVVKLSIRLLILNGGFGRILDGELSNFWENELEQNLSSCSGFYCSYGDFKFSFIRINVSEG